MKRIYKNYKRGRKRGGQRYWIREVGMKKGALSKQLGIKQEKNIPMPLLNKIIKAQPGQRISNPYNIGKREYIVTRKMERRAIMAKNLKNLKK